MDCSFKTDEGSFNLRVAGIFVHNHRLLAMTEQNIDFYYLPGGRVQLHETLAEALRREIGEELGLDIQVIRPLWLYEKFLDPDGGPNHKLTVYFLARLDWARLPTMEGEFILQDPEGKEHTFRWLDDEGIQKVRLSPVLLKECWPHLPDGFTFHSDMRRRGGPTAVDIKFPTPEGLFNYRTAGVVIHDGLLLAMKEDNIDHYYLPGGRVRFRETAAEALCREVREELGVAAQVGRPLWFAESFFPLNIRGETTPVHELALYFLAELDWRKLPSLTGSFTLTDSDGDEHIFTWLRPEEIRSCPIYPLVLKQCWPRLPEQLTLVSDTSERTQYMGKIVD